MSKFQEGDRVVLDKNGSDEYSGEVVANDGGEVTVEWDTGVQSVYHSYELKSE